MKVRIGKSVIEADVANDMIKRTLGLGIGKKRSMLFLMPYEYKWSLWMFTVKYPLTMVFIDKNKNVIDVQRGVPITSDPKTWRTYTPKKKCKYILETPFKSGIRIGDSVSW